nr:probable serine/threonine-protein kinase samkC [Misgurnus anguillicaudatus]
MRDNLVGGPDAIHFFYTSTPNPCKNLNNHFQAAWVSMGLPGKPTFTDLRTSIATHARNTHSSSNRTKVAKFMCHDTSTADKFYAMNLSAKQAVEHRRLFEEALCGEEVSPAKPSEEGTSRKRVAKTKHGGWKRRREESPPTSPSSSSSEVGETVTFQESGVSLIDSPSSLEEYPRTQGLASPPSPSSSDASRESRRESSPEVRTSDQDDPEQEQDDPEQDDPEQQPASPRTTAQQPASPQPTAQEPASPATHKEPR